MNPTEVCRYMADPDNWPWPDGGPLLANGRTPFELALMALSDDAEIVKVDLTVEIRPEPWPCTVCGEKIEPGTAYLVRGPKHLRCAGPRR